MASTLVTLFLLRNPYEQGFREHWVVKQKIKALIQRLAEGTCRQSVQVQKVRRVEDSALWCRYINWKRRSASCWEACFKLRQLGQRDPRRRH